VIYVPCDACPFRGYMNPEELKAVTSYEWVVAEEASKQEGSSKLEEYSSYELRVVVAAEAREQASPS
jgi:hypothetical protein